MKKIILLSAAILFFIKINAQSTFDIKNINPVYLKFLPSDVDPKNLRPSDIPSEQVLKKMGFSELEIREALDFKYSTGKYLENDTAKGNINLSKFYNYFGDTLNLDTASYPKERIYGQGIFRNNKLSFFEKSLDAKAPENYKVGSGDEITIGRVVDSILKATDKSPKVIYDENKPTTIPFKLASIDRIRHELGFEPDYTFDDGIKDTIIWYTNNF